jgi:hypothetical protein
MGRFIQKFCGKNEKFKIILKVYYRVDDITVKINNNYKTF